MPMRVAVCISGSGSNLGALLEAFPPGSEVAFALVLSDREDARGLERARERGIPAFTLADPADALEWLRLLDGHRVELVVLAGYLKLVPGPVVERWGDRMINIHPSLLPAFGGAGMYGIKVHRAVLAAGAAESGASVHLVNAEYDRGAVLARARVRVHPGDTAERLAERVLAAEHRLLPAVVRAAARAGGPVSLPELME